MFGVFIEKKFRGRYGQQGIGRKDAVILSVFTSLHTFIPGALKSLGLVLRMPSQQ